MAAHKHQSTFSADERGHPLFSTFVRTDISKHYHVGNMGHLHTNEPIAHNVLHL